MTTRGLRQATTLGWLAWWLAAPLAMAGCGKRSAGPSCGAVATSVKKLAEVKLAGAAQGAEHQLALEQLSAFSDAIGAKCESAKWPAAVRACAVNATTIEAVQACFTLDAPGSNALPAVPAK